MQLGLAARFNAVRRAYLFATQTTVVWPCAVVAIDCIDVPLGHEAEVVVLDALADDAPPVGATIIGAAWG